MNIIKSAEASLHLNMYVYTPKSLSWTLNTLLSDNHLSPIRGQSDIFENAFCIKYSICTLLPFDIAHRGIVIEN